MIVVIVVVVSLGLCMASLDLGSTRHQGMISGVRMFGQAGPYRPASSSSSLRSHDSDQVGRDICSPTHESGPVVPLESMAESSGTELFGDRHYRFSSGRQWSLICWRENPLYFLHTVTVTADASMVGRVVSPRGWNYIPAPPRVGRLEGRCSTSMAWSSVRFV